MMQLRPVTPVSEIHQLLLLMHCEATKAETERPPAGLLANSLWTGSLRSRAVAAARIPLATYPLRYRAPFTICRRPPREGGRPGCRQHQQRGVTVTAPEPTNRREGPSAWAMPPGAAAGLAPDVN